MASGRGPRAPRGADGRAEPGRFRDDEVRLGYVSGVFGVRGEVRLFLYNPHGDLLFDGCHVELVAPDGIRRRQHVHARSGSGRRVLGTFDGVEDPESASLLVGHELTLPKAELPPLEEGTWYHHQLLGLTVRTAAGRVLGELVEIHGAGEHDTWVVRGADGEAWLVLLPGVVQDVNPDAGEIVVSDDAPTVL